METVIDYGHSRSFAGPIQIKGDGVALRGSDGDTQTNAGGEINALASRRQHKGVAFDRSTIGLERTDTTSFPTQTQRLGAVVKLHIRLSQNALEGTTDEVCVAVPVDGVIDGAGQRGGRRRQGGFQFKRVPDFEYSGLHLLAGKKLYLTEAHRQLLRGPKYLEDSGTAPIESQSVRVG